MSDSAYGDESRKEIVRRAIDATYDDVTKKFPVMLVDPVMEALFRTVFACGWAGGMCHVSDQSDEFRDACLEIMREAKVLMNTEARAMMESEPSE